MELPWTEEEQLLDKSRVFKLKLSLKALTKHTEGDSSSTAGGTSPPATSTVPEGPKRAKVVKIVPPVSTTNQGDYIHVELDRKYDIHSQVWDSANSNGEGLVLKLDRLDPIVADQQLVWGSATSADKKDTVVIWATMPNDSHRFSFHISKSATVNESDPSTLIPYSFQVREASEGKDTLSIVQNSFRDRIWGENIDKSIKGNPVEKNKLFQLRLTFCPQGVAVYIDGRLVSEYINRVGPLIPNEDLFLVVPSRESVTEVPEHVTVNRVWWGHTVPQVPVPGTSRRRLAFAPVAPPTTSGPPEPSKPAQDDGPADRALLIAGLPRDGSAESELARIFEHYQVDSVNGRLCLSVDSSKGQGFVKLQNSRNVQTAINYLNNTRTAFGGTLMVMHARKRQVPAWFET